MKNGGGEIFSVFKGHTDSVNSIVISSDSKWLYSGSDDKAVRRWNIENGESKQFVGHSDAVVSLAISPDGQWLYSGSTDKTIRKWNAETGEKLITLFGHKDTVTSVVISSDGQWFYSGSLDKTIRKWSTVNDEFNSLFKTQVGRVISMSISVDGGLLCSGSHETISMWKTSNGELVREINVSNRRSRPNIIVTINNGYLYYGFDGIICKFNIAKNKNEASFYYDYNTSLICSHDRTWMYSYIRKTIYKWHITTEENKFTTPLVEYSVSDKWLSVGLLEDNTSIKIDLSKELVHDWLTQNNTDKMCDCNNICNIIWKYVE